jgi:hypothetical protein
MARSFNGSSDQITLPTDIAFGSTGFSFATWFFLSVLPPTYTGIMIANNVAVTVGNRLYVKSDGTLAVFSSNSPCGWPTSDPVAGNVLSTNTWYHIAVTTSGSGTFIFYLNGAVLLSTPAGVTASSVALGPVLGNDPPNAGRFFPGRLADAAFWNAVLSAIEIAGLVRGIRPAVVRPQSLVAYLPLDGLASPEPDLSGNRFNGTLTGTANVFGPPVVPLTRRGQRYELFVPSLFTLMPQIVT